MATTRFTVSFTSDAPLASADAAHLKKALGEAVQRMFAEGTVTPEDSDAMVTDFVITVPLIPLKQQ